MAVAQTDRPIVKLPEYKTEHRQLPAMTGRDRALAAALAERDGRLVVEELRETTRIRKPSWIGVVRFEAFEVHVVPKYARENLGVLQMLAHTRGLDALWRAPAVRDLAVQGAHLLELIALLLVEGAEVVARGGLLHDYVPREDQLPLIRGRLRVFEQVTRHPGRVDVLECGFDEFETDTNDNRLIAAALRAIGRHSRHPLVRRRLNRVRAVFDESCEPNELDPAWIHEPIEYHRRNQHYRHAHDLARLVLRRLGVRDLFAPGDGSSFAFLLDMNRLFEDFITILARRALEPGATVRAQRRDRTLLEDVETGRSYGTVIPDLLVEWQTTGGMRRRLPIDAKYKLLEGNRLDPSDLYQLFFYGFAYGPGDLVEGGSRRAFVLYPSASASRSDVRVRSSEGVASARITALGIDLNRLLEEMERGETPVVPALVEIRDLLAMEAVA